MAGRVGKVEWVAPMPPRPGARLGRLSAAIVASALVGSAFLLAGCGSPAVSGPPAGPVAYVATLDGWAHPGNTLALVDTATSKALKSVATGSLPAAMAATPDGAHLLVADKGDNQLTEITMSTGKGTRRLTAGLEPDAVALTPDGSLALVANFGDNTITPVSLLQAEDGIRDTSVTGVQTCALPIFLFFSSRRRHTRCIGDWSSDVCSSD